MNNINLEYVKIYKDLTRNAYKYSLINNEDHAAYTISLFNDDYNSIDDFNKCVEMCERLGFNTYDDYCQYIQRYIKSINNVLRNRALRSIQPQPITVPSEKIFAKLDPTRTYMALDVTHAISQYVDSLKIFSKPFEEMVFANLDDEYLINSKGLRIFIYTQFRNYNFNDNLIEFTRALLDSDHELIVKLKELGIEVASYNVDELVFDVTDHKDEIEAFVGDHVINGINTHVSLFVPHAVVYIDEATNKNKAVHIRYDILTGKSYFQQRTCKYMNQIFKVYNGIDITDEDLYVQDDFDHNSFYKLNEPITIVNVE